ncbi:hypothetical protein [Streptomyces lydicus]|uniref:hypothetical protein n=2 Tax=Streptomyces lydicus TaxID=47763 RepID=UPI0010139730|nr:hypothetical protein [Streptomyces lydicus]
MTGPRAASAAPGGIAEGAVRGTEAEERMNTAVRQSTAVRERTRVPVAERSAPPAELRCDRTAESSRGIAPKKLIAELDGG